MSFEYCSKLTAILSEYELVSGQKVNLSKSSLYFSKGVSDVCREEITSILGIPQGSGKGKYLGLPYMTGRSKKEIFAFVRERVIKKLSGWKEKLLSNAGKEVFIKSIIQAIPTYVMQCFLLPVSLIRELEVHIRRFFWGGSDGSSKIHWKAWASCCLSKSLGGLGFRDLAAFNRALLAKQAWRLLKSPSSLAATILKAKYFPGSDILSAQLTSRPSFMWRSLLEGRDLLSIGVRWRIGGGNSVHVYDDPWIPLEPYFRPLPCAHSLPFDCRVRDLLLPGGVGWNEGLVRSHFFPFEADKILELPVVGSHQEDKLIWHHHPKGVYTVKSGYHLAAFRGTTHAPVGPSTGPSLDSQLWKILWRAPLQPRIQHFVWRLVHNCLPVAVNLSTRRVGAPTCGVCGDAREDLFHCFIGCAIPSAVISRSDILHRCLAFRPTSMQELLMIAFRGEGEEGFCLVVTILWHAWNSRCKAIFEGKPISISALLAVAEKQWHDHMQSVAAFSPPLANIPTWPALWSKPPPGFVKVNVDGAVGLDRSALGVVIRDSMGNILHTETLIIGRQADVVVLELLALRTGLLAAFHLGFSHVCLEGDSLVAITKLQAAEEDLSSSGSVVDSINALASCFSCVHFSFIKRTSNVPAHLLARCGLGIPYSTIWNGSIPHDVFLATLTDL